MDVAQAFREWRPYLFTVAYNITGDRQGAEDIVQDCFEVLLAKPQADVRNPKAYLTRIVVHKAVDRLESRKRVNYVGHWMPEPLITLEAPSVEEPVSYPLLHALEVLNPPERAVFLLREGFDLPYDEVAEICDTSPENCRQLLHRAKTRIRSQAAGHTDAAQAGFLRSFLDACRAEDPEELTQLLKADITLYADGGGKRAAILEPAVGAPTVAKLLRGIAALVGKLGFTVHEAYVNGRPGILFMDGDALETVLTLSLEDGHVAGCYIVRNPDKLFLPAPVTK